MHFHWNHLAHCRRLRCSSADPSAPAFKRREWNRAQCGRGVSCTFSAPSYPDSLLEKAGVNISTIYGQLPPASIAQMAAENLSLAQKVGSTGSLPFFSGGLSLVIYPRNPSVPTVHANYRYFEIVEASTDDKTEPKIVLWWWDHRPYTKLLLRGGRRPFPLHHQGRLRCPRFGPLPCVQEVMRPLLLH